MPVYIADEMNKKVKKPVQYADRLLSNIQGKLNEIIYMANEDCVYTRRVLLEPEIFYKTHLYKNNELRPEVIDLLESYGYFLEYKYDYSETTLKNLTPNIVGIYLCWKQ